MPIASINPTTGETVRTFAPLTGAGLEAKLAKAAAAFAHHRETPFFQRAKGLEAAADILTADEDRLAWLMTLEMGKPLAQARAEVAKCAVACRYYAAHGERMLADEPLPEAEGRCHVRYEPLGPVLAIMPWNFPLWQVVRFAAPALMAGNVGLLKHAASVPQCGLALEELFLRAGFPEGCFQNLLIENDAVARVIEDDRVAAVTLTGSVGAGRAVAALAGKQLKPTVLELGGSDPFIVLPSAPVADTVAQAVHARMQNNGQSCIAAKRFIVHDEIYEKFEALFVDSVSRLRVGDPFEPGTDVGPLAQARAIETLEAQVRAGVEAGARVLIGGRRREGPGFFFEPTVLAGVPADGPFAREELFGPVAMLFRARNFDDALALANRSPFGLGASLWTRDEAEQVRGVRELRAGQVFVNAIVASQPALPFGGIKESGYGRELGTAGIRGFTNAKTICVAA
ncbi:MAG: NAD-dependent succinate-semialdehyde dehydrogenase [Verrucomicrobiota bacterium]